MLQRLMNNPHTSLAAILYVAGVFLANAGAIWFPAHADQFAKTAALIKEVAVTYGFVMAGDSSKKSKDGGSGSNKESSDGTGK